MPTDKDRYSPGAVRELPKINLFKCGKCGIETNGYATLLLFWSMHYEKCTGPDS
jgi:hypothetical protein